MRDRSLAVAAQALRDSGFRDSTPSRQRHSAPTWTMSKVDNTRSQSPGDTGSGTGPDDMDMVHIPLPVEPDSSRKSQMVIPIIIFSLTMS